MSATATMAGKEQTAPSVSAIPHACTDSQSGQISVNAMKVGLAELAMCPTVLMGAATVTARTVRHASACQAGIRQAT